jgi:hypothetical protein
MIEMTDKDSIKSLRLFIMDNMLKMIMAGLCHFLSGLVTLSVECEIEKGSAKSESKTVIERRIETNIFY